jgi:predicted nucleic acid-binding protein
MMYLLDTNVVSELRKAKSGKMDRHVKAWTAGVDAASMFLSVITVLELELGTLLMERRDSRQGTILRNWLENQVFPTFGGRILVVDIAAAQRAAALQVPNPRSYRDSLIAATAIVHGMTVVTRNVKDFAPAGVQVLNPWQD